MVLRVSQKDIKFYMIPSSRFSYAYFHEEMPGRYEPYQNEMNAAFSEKTYLIYLKKFRDFNEEIYLTLNAFGHLESQHPIYHPKLKKISSGYCISFILKDGDHQWLAIIKGNDPIPAGFNYYEDDYGEDDI